MDACSIPPDALLRHASFLRSLARDLLRDPDRADDAVQETWLASLAHPPRRPGGVRAWLATVLRNAARQGRRGEGRRARRERRAARPEATPSAGDAVARHEIVRRVAAAVCALPEPYRTTIVLRYYEGAAPRAIARRTGVPVETVKSRLQRARALLRRSLEENVAEWRAGLAPWMGVIAMGGKTWIAAAAAALVLGVAAWRSLDGVGTVERPPAASGTILAHHDGDPTGPAPELRGAVSAPEVALAGGRPPEAPGRPPPAALDVVYVTPDVEGIVVSHGDPVRGGKIRVLDVGTGGSEVLVPIAEDGSFRIRGPRSDSLVFLAEVEGRQARSVAVRTVGDRRRVRVALGSGRIWGTLLDGIGRPARRARINASTFLRDREGALSPSAEGDVFDIATETDLDGKFEFRDLPSGTFVIVAQPDSDVGSARNIRSFEVTLAAGESRRLDIGGDDDEPLWSGVVRYADGTPVSSAGNVFLESAEGGRRLYVSFDDEGRFAQEVPPGTYRMEFVLPSRWFEDGMRLVATEATLTIEDRPLVQDLAFPGTRVEGRVRGHDPVRGSAHVVLSRVGGAAESPPSLFGARKEGRHEARVGSDGSFRIDGLRPGTYAVSGRPRPLLLEGMSDGTIEVRAVDARMELVLVEGSG